MNKIFSKNLKRLRLKLGYSAEQMAQELDIPVRTLGGYERGERVPSMELATRLSKLNVNLNWFVTGQGEMFNSPKYEDIQDEFEKKVEGILRKKGLIK